LAIVAALVWPAPLSSQSATVTTAGGEVHVRAPGLRFIDGAPLARLKDGRAVRVELALDVLADPGAAPTAQKRQTCVLSYDLWEERFAATIDGDPTRAISHLTPASVEAWCVQQLDLPVSALGPLAHGQPFWIRLAYRVLDGSRAERDDGGLTLGGLIDAMSRRRKAGDVSRSIEAGPVRVQE
jgi:hypothetical protein